MGKFVDEATVDAVRDAAAHTVEAIKPQAGQEWAEFSGPAVSISEDLTVGGLGFLNGVTLGLSDYIISKTPLAEEYAKAKAANSTAATIGEIASFFSPGVTLKLAQYLVKGAKLGGKGLQRLAKSNADKQLLGTAKVTKTAAPKTFSKAELADIQKHVSKSLASNPGRISTVVNATGRAMEKASGKVDAFIGEALNLMSNNVQGKHMLEKLVRSVGGVGMQAFLSGVMAYRANLSQGLSHEDAWALASKVAAGSAVGYAGASMARWTKLGRLLFGNPGKSGIPNVVRSMVGDIVAKTAGYHIVVDTPVHQAVEGAIGTAKDIAVGAKGKFVDGEQGFNQGGKISEAEGWAAESAKYVEDNKDVANITARDILEFVPVVGDILGAEEIYRELQKDDVNWALVGALGGATIIGLIPGIGDAAAAGIRAGARAGLKGVKGGIELAKRIEVDPDAVGSFGGNIRLKPKDEFEDMLTDDFTSIVGEPTEAFERSFKDTPQLSKEEIYERQVREAKADIDGPHSDSAGESVSDIIDEAEATSLFAQSKDRSVDGGRYPDFKPGREEPKTHQGIVGPDYDNPVKGTRNQYHPKMTDPQHIVDVEGTNLKLSKNVKKQLDSLPQEARDVVLKFSLESAGPIPNEPAALYNANAVFNKYVQRNTDIMRKKLYDADKDRYYGIRQVDEFVDPDGKSWPITGNPDAMSGDLPDIEGQDLLPFDAQTKLKMRKQELGEHEVLDSDTRFEAAQDDAFTSLHMEGRNPDEIGGIIKREADAKKLADEEALIKNVDDSIPTNKKLNASELHYSYDKVENHMSPREYVEKLREKGNKFTDKQADRFIELREGTGKEDYQAKQRAYRDSKKTGFNAGGILKMNAGGSVKRKRGIICG